MTKTQGNFKLKVIEGEFTDSQIIVMLGENGTGKTTFIRMLVPFVFHCCSCTCDLQTFFFIRYLCLTVESPYYFLCRLV